MRRIREQERMVHNPAIRGPELHRANISSLCEIHRHDEALIGIGTIGGNLKRLWGLDNQIRRSKLPVRAVEMRWRGFPFRVSSWRAASSPVFDRSDLRERESARMLEMVVTGNGLPWRHDAPPYHSRD